MSRVFHLPKGMNKVTFISAIQTLEEQGKILGLIFIDSSKKKVPTEMSFTSFRMDFYTGATVLIPDMCRQVKNAAQHQHRGMHVGYAFNTPDTATLTCPTILWDLVHDRLIDFLIFYMNMLKGKQAKGTEILCIEVMRPLLRIPPFYVVNGKRHEDVESIIERHTVVDAGARMVIEKLMHEIDVYPDIQGNTALKELVLQTLSVRFDVTIPEQILKDLKVAMKQEKKKTKSTSSSSTTRTKKEMKAAKRELNEDEDGEMVQPEEYTLSTEESEEEVEADPVPYVPRHRV